MSYNYHDLNLYFPVIGVGTTTNANRIQAESHRKQELPINADKLLIPSTPSTYSRSAMSPLKLSVIQSNGPSIVSSNYPNTIIKHTYRWPFITSTTTANFISYAKKPRMNRLNSENDLNIGVTPTSTEVAVVDHRAHPYHHSGLG